MRELDSTVGEERLKKLPAWARAMLQGRDQKIRDLQARVAELTNTEPTRILADPYADYLEGGSRFLPDRADVAYDLGALADPVDKFRDKIYVGLRAGRGGPEANHLVIQGDHGITIRPQSGNTFKVFLGEL